MKKLLINLLIISSCHAFAGDLAFYFGKVVNNNFTFGVSNHNESEPILLKSFQVKVDNNICLSDNKETKLSPQEPRKAGGEKSGILNLKTCFGLNKNAEIVGVTDVPSSLAITPGKGLLRKDIEVKVSYIKEASKVIESESNFSLLFIQK